MTALDPRVAPIRDYDTLPTTSPLGAPLDWKWLKGAKSE